MGIQLVLSQVISAICSTGYLGGEHRGRTEQQSTAFLNQIMFSEAFSHEEMQVQSSGPTQSSVTPLYSLYGFYPQAGFSQQGEDLSFHALFAPKNLSFTFFMSLDDGEESKH